MQILNQAAKAAHQARLNDSAEVQRYSNFPVHETEFWTTIFKAAKVRKTAQAVIDEMRVIESEPCIDNERVFRNVQTAINLAKIALLQ
jgi:hypothetical protein